MSKTKKEHKRLSREFFEEEDKLFTAKVIPHRRVEKRNHKGEKEIDQGLEEYYNNNEIP